MRVLVNSGLGMVCLFLYMSVPAWGGQNVTPHTVFKGSTTQTGQSIEYPTDGPAQITSILLEFEPGDDVGWHKHLAPTYIYVIKGTVTVEFSDGRQEEFKAGEGFIPVMNVWHNARNLGSGPATALLVIAGVQGKAGIVFRDAQ